MLTGISGSNTVEIACDDRRLQRVRLRRIGHEPAVSSCAGVGRVCGIVWLRDFIGDRGGTERSSSTRHSVDLSRRSVARCFERGLERVPGEARALHAHRETRARRRAPTACPGPRPAVSGGVVTIRWKRSKSALRLARPVCPLSASVISDADAFEIAQPEPWKPTSVMTSPSTFTIQRRGGRRRAGCSPRPCGSASSSARKFRGRLLWSRITSW